MCNAWNHPSNCSCGWGESGNSKYIEINNRAPSNSVWSYQDSYAAPSCCPYCGNNVYFIRHNGGTIWVDQLGWPWPKHACFISDSEPAWVSYLRERTYIASNSLDVNHQELCSHPCTGFAGLVVQARHLHLTKSAIVGLAIDGGKIGRRLAVIDGDNTAEYYVGSIAAFDHNESCIAFSNHNVKDIKRIVIPPSYIGLPHNWLLNSTLIQCPNCSTMLNQKNLVKHLMRKHAYSSEDAYCFADSIGIKRKG